MKSEGWFKASIVCSCMAIAFYVVVLATASEPEPQTMPDGYVGTAEVYLEKEDELVYRLTLRGEGLDSIPQRVRDGVTTVEFVIPRGE